MALENGRITKQKSQPLKANPATAVVSKNKPTAIKEQPLKTHKVNPPQATTINKNGKTDKPANVPPKTISNVIGEITWLMTQSTSHKYFFISDLDWMIMPPVSLGQFRIFHGEKFPVGVAFWAYVDDNIGERIQKGITRMRPGDWNSGQNLWLVDLISPFGSTQKMLDDLVLNVFKQKTFKYLQRNEEGNMIVMESKKATAISKPENNG